MRTHPLTTLYRINELAWMKSTEFNQLCPFSMSKKDVLSFWKRNPWRLRDELVRDGWAREMERA